MFEENKEFAVVESKRGNFRIAFYLY